MLEKRSRKVKSIVKFISSTFVPTPKLKTGRTVHNRQSLLKKKWKRSSCTEIIARKYDCIAVKTKII